MSLSKDSKILRSDIQSFNEKLTTIYKEYGYSSTTSAITLHDSISIADMNLLIGRYNNLITDEYRNRNKFPSYTQYNNISKDKKLSSVTITAMSGKLDNIRNSNTHKCWTNCCDDDCSCDSDMCKNCNCDTVTCKCNKVCDCNTYCSCESICTNDCNGDCNCDSDFCNSYKSNTGCDHGSGGCTDCRCDSDCGDCDWDSCCDSHKTQEYLCKCEKDDYSRDCNGDCSCDNDTCCDTYSTCRCEQDKAETYTDLP